MTCTSIMWGRSLQLCSAKLLLAAGLLMNAACTFVFGFLRNKGLMYAAKFVMGATQSLQGVWSTVWTVTMAPPESKTMWLGLGAVSAGLGNGIGTAVAGFGTANGMNYAFAFIVQACVLAALWVFLVMLLPSWLALSVPVREDSKSGLDRCPSSSLSLSGTPEEAPSALAQSRALRGNKVYLWTCLAISLAMFE